MKKFIIIIFVIFVLSTIGIARSRKSTTSFDQLFPKTKQRQMGLHKLTSKEKKYLRSHVESLLLSNDKPDTKTKNKNKSKEKKNSTKVNSEKIYISVGKDHWIKKNIDGGAFIILEDSSLWKIDPLNKVDTMLWMAMSEIMVTESTTGSPGYDYLLINTDDGEKAHAKYIGEK